MEHRKLEELVGQVSRVTDLMELLESVETAKADEYSKNFEDGEVIEFEEALAGGSRRPCTPCGSEDAVRLVEP